MGDKTKIGAKIPTIEGKGVFCLSRMRGISQKTDSPVDHILSLQRHIGNQAVKRLCASGSIQPSLRSGQPNDKYEQEADRVAEQVVRMPDPGILMKPT